MNPLHNPTINVDTSNDVPVASVTATTLGRHECIDLHTELLVLSDQHNGRVICSLNGVKGGVEAITSDLAEVGSRCEELDGRLVVCDVPDNLAERLNDCTEFDVVGSTDQAVAFFKTFKNRKAA